jgi:hypothetical protein
MLSFIQEVQLLPNQRISQELKVAPARPVDLPSLWRARRQGLLAKLRREIPPPKAKVAKAQASFATLKPGDALRHLGTTNLEPCVIASVDSLGAYTEEGTVIGKDWKTQFEKLKKRRTKK